MKKDTLKTFAGLAIIGGIVVATFLYGNSQRQAQLRNDQNVKQAAASPTTVAAAGTATVAPTTTASPKVAAAATTTPAATAATAATATPAPKAAATPAPAATPVPAAAQTNAPVAVIPDTGAGESIITALASILIMSAWFATSRRRIRHAFFTRA